MEKLVLMHSVNKQESGELRVLLLPKILPSYHPKLRRLPSFSLTARWSEQFGPELRKLRNTKAPCVLKRTPIGGRRRGRSQGAGTTKAGQERWCSRGRTPASEAWGLGEGAEKFSGAMWLPVLQFPPRALGLILKTPKSHTDAWQESKDQTSTLEAKDLPGTQGTWVEPAKTRGGLIRGWFELAGLGLKPGSPIYQTHELAQVT